jgi:hypothetical protein
MEVRLILYTRVLCMHAHHSTHEADQRPRDGRVSKDGRGGSNDAFRPAKMHHGHVFTYCERFGIKKKRIPGREMGVCRMIGVGVGGAGAGAGAGVLRVCACVRASRVYSQAGAVPDCREQAEGVRHPLQQGPPPPRPPALDPPGLRAHTDL